MSEEELENKAEEYAEKQQGVFRFLSDHIKLGFIAGAKEIQKEKEELKEENEQLKQKIKNIGDFIQTGDLCSICKFENKCNPNECYSQNVRVYKKWELAE